MLCNQEAREECPEQVWTQTRIPHQPHPEDDSKIKEDTLKKIKSFTNLLSSLLIHEIVTMV